MKKKIEQKVLLGVRVITMGIILKEFPLSRTTSKSFFLSLSLPSGTVTWLNEREREREWVIQLLWLKKIQQLKDKRNVPLGIKKPPQHDVKWFKRCAIGGSGWFGQYVLYSKTKCQDDWYLSI